MRNRELHKQHQQIKKLFDKTQIATGEDIELQSHWAKYLCVLSSGFLENAISEVYKDFVKQAPEPIANYASSVLSKIRNPKSDKFVQTARTFKATWSDDLTDFLDENNRKEAIDSIMANRHLIAHGKNSGVTVIRVRGWFDKSVEVINFIEKQCIG